MLILIVIYILINISPKQLRFLPIFAAIPGEMCVVRGKLKSPGMVEIKWPLQ